MHELACKFTSAVTVPTKYKAFGASLNHVEKVEKVASLTEKVASLTTSFHSSYKL